jgi:hypothetical protein
MPSPNSPTDPKTLTGNSLSLRQTENEVRAAPLQKRAPGLYSNDELWLLFEVDVQIAKKHRRGDLVYFLGNSGRYLYGVTLQSSGVPVEGEANIRLLDT